MGLINKVDMVCLSPVGYGVYIADVSSVSPSSDVGLTLETSVKHHIPQATNIPYQPCCKCGSFTLHA